MSHADLESLGRRAANCRWWRGHVRIQYIPISAPATLVGYRWQEAQHSAVPDFSDPLTVGWLLALVREKWGTVYAKPEEDRWTVRGPTGHVVGQGPTEAEALVAALEVQNG